MLQKELAVSDKALHEVGDCFGTRPEGHLRLCGSAEIRAARSEQA